MSTSLVVPACQERRGSSFIGRLGGRGLVARGLFSRWTAEKTAQGNREKRIPAGIHSLEGGEFSVSVSQVPPVDPIRAHHLDVFIQSPRASPGGMMPQRASPTSQRVEITPQRLEPAPRRASSAGHQRPRRTRRRDPVEDPLKVD